MAGVWAVSRPCGSFKEFVKGADAKKKKKKRAKPATKLVYSFRNTVKSALGGKEAELEEKTTPPHIIFDNLAKNISTFWEVRQQPD